MTELIYMFAVILIDLDVDFYLIAIRKKQIRHFNSVILPVVLLLGGFYLNWQFLLGEIEPAICALIMFPSTRWIIHDYGLNALRGLPLDYLGEGPDSALSDRFIRIITTRTKVSGLMIRVIAFLISLTLTLIIRLC